MALMPEHKGEERGRRIRPSRAGSLLPLSLTDHGRGEGMGRICRKTASRKKTPKERELPYNPTALMKWLIMCHKKEQERVRQEGRELRLERHDTAPPAELPGQEALLPSCCDVATQYHR